MKKNIIIYFVIFISFIFLKIDNVYADVNPQPNGVRYDINYFEVNTTSDGKQSISMAGWALYKTDGTNLFNNGRDGEYAPTYSFRFIDTTNGNSTAFEYNYNPSNSTGFSLTCPLHDYVTAWCDPSDANYRYYDNVDFSFEGWDVQFEVGHTYLLQMMITIPEVANGWEVNTGWFDVKIVNVSGSNAHEIAKRKSGTISYDDLSSRVPFDSPTG